MSVRSPRPGGHGSRLVAACIALLLSAPTLRAACPEDAGDGGTTRRWPGPDGFLPFRSDPEVKRFLAESEVIAIEDIPTGVTRPKKVTLELDGVRAQAAFRYIEESSRREQMRSGKVIIDFRDSYRNEIAAYELARLLGMDNVPPAIGRTIERTAGSVQLWIGGITELERGRRGAIAPDPARYQRQLADMHVFDALINNFDRNQGNMLWDADWTLWLIDHTRSFNRAKRLLEADRVDRCSRRLYEALRDLDLDRVDETLEPYLSDFERQALRRRHERLVVLLDRLIAERGRDAVLLDERAEAATP